MAAESETATCSTCEIKFDPDGEGMVGNFGIIPVAFCPTCMASCWDMWREMRGCDDCFPCPECGYEGDEAE